MTGFDAVILAGGAATRLGGIDKPALTVGSRSLLESALAASAAALRTVVVGPHRDVSRPVWWAMEEPAGSGPAAALRAGFAHTTAEVVVVLAADLPFVTAEVIGALAAGARPTDGVVAIDASGRRQWLLSAWPAGLLNSALADPLDGAALRAALGSLPHTLLEIDPHAAFDCDTPADVDLARSR